MHNSKISKLRQNMQAAVCHLTASSSRPILGSRLTGCEPLF